MFRFLYYVFIWPFKLIINVFIWPAKILIISMILIFKLCIIVSAAPIIIVLLFFLGIFGAFLGNVKNAIAGKYK